jgi:putative copper resistance protein D
VQWSAAADEKFPGQLPTTASRRLLGIASIRWKAATTVQSSQTHPSEPATRRWPLLLLAAGCVTALAGLVCYALASGQRVYTTAGEAYPGAVTAVAEPVGYFIAALAGGVCFGGLLYVVVVACPDTHGVIDERAFRAHLVVERSSILWALTAAAMVVVQAANNAGASVARLLGSAVIGDAVLASEMSRAWIAVTLAAIVVAVCIRLSVRWVTHFVLLLPALIGVVALPVSGNAGQGPDHDYATSAAIVFAVALAALMGIKTAAAISPPASELKRRVLILEIVCGAVVLGYGAVLLSILTDPGDLAGTAYGRAGAAAAAVLVLVWLTDLGSLGSSRRRALPAPVHDVGHLPRLCVAGSTECADDPDRVAVRHVHRRRRSDFGAGLRARIRPPAPARRQLAPRAPCRVVGRVPDVGVHQQFRCQGLRVGHVQRSHG